MARSQTILVPVDFSRCADRAFDYALRMAHETHGKVVALHVVPAGMVYPPAGRYIDLYRVLEREARANFAKLLKRKRLQTKNFDLLVERGTDFAEVIARQAKKLRASIIVMGSHGRTGLRRLLLGSVAERTLRYAQCPVLIVK